VLVVAQRRARPVPARPLAGAGGAHRVLAHRMREGQAAPVAYFTLDGDGLAIQMV
jgi:hypothetical protein